MGRGVEGRIRKCAGEIKRRSTEESACIDIDSFNGCNSNNEGKEKASKLSSKRAP